MAVTFQGATGAGATSVSLPTHAVGDLIVISAAASGTTIPTAPSAGGTVPTWTTIATDGTYGHRLAYAVATATNHTTGTWTNAEAMMSAVLRGQKSSSPAGGNATSGDDAALSTVTAPAVTLSDSGGGSAILHFLHAAAGLTGRNWNSAPAGYTSRLSVNPPSIAWGYRLLTKDTTTSDGAASNTLTGNLNGICRTASLEVLAAADSGRFFAMF
jgi:hypothetical protein